MERPQELPHLRPTLGHAEAAAAKRVLDSAYVGRGPETARFEDEICDYLGLGKGHALAVASGTAALQLALRVLNWKQKRVAVPMYTCASVHHAVRLAGATPVPIDTVSADQADMDLGGIGAAGAEAAIVAHMFGIPQALDNVQVPFIEDCAQALGASVKGKPVGLQGLVGVFSFGATKMITSGGIGGAIASKDRRLLDKARELIAYERASEKPHVNSEIGDLQSAIGRVQLKRLPKFIARREKLFQKYVEAGLPLMTARDQNVVPVRFRAVVVSDLVEDIQKALAAENIRSRIAIIERELAKVPATSNTAALAKRALFIPIFPEMTDDDCDRVAEVVTRATRSTRKSHQ